MKFLLALGVLLTAAPSWADVEKSGELAAFYGASVAVQSERLTFTKMRSRREPAY